MTEALTAHFYSARPRFRIDGEADGMLSASAVCLSVEETADGLYSCEATFTNWGSVGSDVSYVHFDRDVLDFGRELSVEMGDGDARGDVFAGKITAIEGRFPPGGTPEVLVLAEDRLQDLRMTRRTRTFEDTTVADMVEQVARDHGLTPQVSLEGPTFPVLAQVNQSDLAFLRESALALDGEIWVDGDTLHAASHSQRTGEEVTLRYGDRLLQFVVSADLAEQRTKLTVGGWDVQAKEAIAVEADATAIERELNGLDSGASILQDKFGARAEQVVHTVPHSTAEARARAEASFRRMARRFVRGTGVTEGDARLRVGATVILRQVGALFDGSYRVTQVKHVFGAQEGYRTYFSVERPGLGSA